MATKLLFNQMVPLCARLLKETDHCCGLHHVDLHDVCVQRHITTVYVMQTTAMRVHNANIVSMQYRRKFDQDHGWKASHAILSLQVLQQQKVTQVCKACNQQVKSGHIPPRQVLAAVGHTAWPSVALPVLTGHLDLHEAAAEPELPPAWAMLTDLFNIEAGIKAFTAQGPAKTQLQWVRLLEVGNT